MDLDGVRLSEVSNKTEERLMLPEGTGVGGMEETGEGNEETESFSYKVNNKRDIMGNIVTNIVTIL